MAVTVDVIAEVDQDQLRMVTGVIRSAVRKAVRDGIHDALSEMGLIGRMGSDGEAIILPEPED